MNLHGIFLPKLQRSHVEKMVDQIMELREKIAEKMKKKNNIEATAVSRWWYSAARDHVVFPETIGKINEKHHSPLLPVSLWRTFRLNAEIFP